MIRGKSGQNSLRLACLGLTTSLTVLWLFGCGQEQTTGVVNDAPEHAKKVSKNMEDFMKTNPYKNQGKEQATVK